MKNKFLLVIVAFFAQVSVNAQFNSGAAVAVGTTGITVRIDTTPTLVTATLTGPSNSYIGMGFGNSGMASGTDGFIYNSAAARDYTFQGVGVTPVQDVNQDWNVITNTVDGSTRTLVATRSLSGSAEDTPILNAPGTIDLNVARGNNTLTLSYHGAANRDYVTLTMLPNLGTGDADLTYKILLYPNPSNGIVNFKASEKIKTLAVYDSTGRLVNIPKMKESSIDLTSLKAGIYLIEIVNIDGVKSYEKLIKK